MDREALRPWAFALMALAGALIAGLNLVLLLSGQAPPTGWVFVIIGLVVLIAGIVMLIRRSRA